MTYTYKRVRGTKKANRYANQGWEIVGPASAFGVYTVRREQADHDTHKDVRLGLLKITQGILILVVVLAIFSTIAK